MPRLIIHAGTPKTGSTSFQRFLWHNEKALRRRGLARAPTFAPKGLGHLKLGACLLGSSQIADADEVREGFWAALAAEPEMDVILSDELFATRLSQKDAAGAERLAQIADRARRTGHEVEFVACLRHFPAFLESDYAQQAKSFTAKLAFEDEMRRAARRPAYLARQAESLRRTGLRTTFIPVNAETRRRGVERAIVEALGHGWDGLDAPPLANERIGIVRTALSLALTERLLAGRPITLDQARALRQVVRAECMAQGGDDPQYRPMTPEIARRIEQTHMPQAEAFAQDVWGTSWAEVFARDLGCPRPTSTITVNADPERYLRIASELFRAALPKAVAMLDAEVDRTWRGWRVVAGRERLRGQDILDRPAGPARPDQMRPSSG